MGFRSPKPDLKSAAAYLLEREGKEPTEPNIKNKKPKLSKDLKRLEQEQPDLYAELLQAARDRVKREEAEVESGETPETPSNPSNSSENASNENKGTNTQMISFRADMGDIRRWRAYAQARDMTATQLYTSAISSYIDANPLTDAADKARYMPR